MPPNTAARLELEKRFRTSSELDAFILDYFPETWKLLSSQMNRLEKVNILLESNGAEKVLAEIQEASKKYLETLAQSSVSQEKTQSEHSGILLNIGSPRDKSRQYINVKMNNIVQQKK